MKLCEPLVTHGSYLSVLETGDNKALYKCTFVVMMTVPVMKVFRGPRTVKMPGALCYGLGTINIVMGITCRLIIIL